MLFVRLFARWFVPVSYSSWCQGLDVIVAVPGLFFFLLFLPTKSSKCQIGYGSIVYLSHNIVGQTIRPQEDKIRAVKETPRPTTKKRVRACLGLAGFYRRFFPTFVDS